MFRGGVSNIAASFDSGLDVANDEVDVNVSPSASPVRNTSLEYEEVYRVGEVFPGSRFCQWLIADNICIYQQIRKFCLIFPSGQRSWRLVEPLTSTGCMMMED